MAAKASAVIDWVMAKVPARALHLASSLVDRVRGNDEDEWVAHHLERVDEVASLLADGAGWELCDSPTDGAVAIVDPGDGQVPTVVRLARSAAAAEVLEQHWRQINEIAADERLGEWRNLAPRPHAHRTGADPPYVVESLTAGRLGAKAPDLDAAARLAIAGLAPLHERTSGRRVVDDREVDEWIRRPIERLADIVTRNREGLEPLERRLAAAWHGHDVTRSRILGDVSLGNVLLAASPPAVVGYPDWRRGSIGPTVTDHAHLALTAGAERHGRDLGAQLLQVLANPSLLAADPLLAGVDVPVAPADVALLTWLWHVDASPHRSSRLWSVRNVEAVLAELRR